MISLRSLKRGHKQTSRSIRQRENTDQGIEPLDIVVPYTTPQLTRLALKNAEELSTEIPTRIRVLRMQNVPYPLDLSRPPVCVDVLANLCEKEGYQAALVYSK